MSAQTFAVEVNLTEEEADTVLYVAHNEIESKSSRSPDELASVIDDELELGDDDRALDIALRASRELGYELDPYDEAQLSL